MMAINEQSADPTNPPISWQWLHFDALNTQQLYAILQLRCEVFVVEQNCVYQDVDGLDSQCWHLLGWCPPGSDGAPRLVAYLRGVPPGVKFAEASIGRVISHASVRGSGAGRALLAQALSHMQEEFPDQALRIAAQCYLQRFYESFGFVVCSDAYDEDGIPHVDMLRGAGA